MKFSDKIKEHLSKSVQVVWVRRPEVLLCPNTPKPLHGVVPREIYGQSWWNKTREAAYRSTNYHCLACGVHKYQAKHRQWLEGHELYEINYVEGTSTYIETVPLCHFCHNSIHDGRLMTLLQKGELHQAKYVAIIQHADRVLAEAGLQKMTRADREKEFVSLVLEGKIAPWKKWRLILDGKEYPTPYSDINEWKKAHD